MTHTPRKRFGQNFLRDPIVVERLLHCIAPSPTDHFVEIGPGEGALTAPLLTRCQHLDAVEIDRDLAAELTRRYAGQASFRVHQADALRFDFRSLAAGNTLRIVGNLPYNISTPLLFHLFTMSAVIADMHFMLQREVVDRLTASPGGKAYGRLSVMTAYHCRAEPLFEVGPESFFPRPKVVSAVVRLLPHAIPPASVEAVLLGQVVSAAFSQRRKTLRNSLGALFETADWRAAEIDPGRRAETLSLAEFARLAQRLSLKRADPPSP